MTYSKTQAHEELAKIVRSAGDSLPTTALATSHNDTDFRTVITDLLAEIPADTVVFATASGIKYTAGALRDLIATNNEVGLQFACDLLRIARDFLGRKARSAPRK